MPFLKVSKSKAYFKRFQVQYRRRREGKTDYQARRHLTHQDKNKYNSPKYRLVVRITNRDIIAQVIIAKIVGDEVVACAYSHELPRYGIKVGLTNYAAAYATGLLLARRVLTKLGLAEQYQGVEKVTGEMFEVEESGERRPFFCVLDLGLVRTTTGSRVFGVMKGAADGGIHIPHSERRFVGYKKEGGAYDAEMHRQHIFGLHVANYMKSLKESDAEAYQRQFSAFIKAGITHDKIEKMYKEAHAKIRKDPTFKSAAKPKDEKVPQKRFGRVRLTLSQRKDRIRQKIESAKKKAAAGGDE